MDWNWLFFSFEGRINRAKWWLALLIFIVLSAVVWLVVLPILGFSIWNVTSPWASALVSLIVTVIFAYPATAIMVKRLNDRDRPKWLVAVFWAPTILTLLAQLLGVGATMQEIGGGLLRCRPRLAGSSTCLRWSLAFGPWWSLAS